MKLRFPSVKGGPLALGTVLAIGAVVALGATTAQGTEIPPAKAGPVVPAAKWVTP
jgi:hypothetical protein